MTQFDQTRIFLNNFAKLQKKQLLKVFWLIAFGLFIYELFWTNTNSLLINFAALLITGAALIPIYFWCAGKALGMPVFPLFAATFIWTHALPLLIHHPQIEIYSINEQLFTAVIVAGFLILGTLIWFQFVKSSPSLPKYYRALSSKKGDAFFFLVLIISILFDFSNNGGWLFLLGGLFSTFRAAILGLTILSTFVLAYRLGTKELSKQQSQLFLILLTTYIIADGVTLLLVGSASTFLVGCVGFIIGRKKLPITVIIITILCFSLLQYGKGDMRVKYWNQQSTIYFQPWDYPRLYTEWVDYSLNYLNQKQHQSIPESEKKQSFLERASTIQLLLLVQDKSPKSVPYLYGETYAILPQVIVPRIFDSNKIRTDEGTSILNVHYGLQTYEQSLTTTIGWSLIAEAYANFGIAGCAGLGVILGTIYGITTRWSINTPILSAQSMFTIVMLTFAFQTELTAGVYVAAWFQSGVVVALISLCLTDTYWIKLPENSIY